MKTNYQEGSMGLNSIYSRPRKQVKVDILFQLSLIRMSFSKSIINSNNNNNIFFLNVGAILINVGAICPGTKCSHILPIFGNKNFVFQLQSSSIRLDSCRLGFTPSIIRYQCVQIRELKTKLLLH